MPTATSPTLALATKRPHHREPFRRSYAPDRRTAHSPPSKPNPRTKMFPTRNSLPTRNPTRRSPLPSFHLTPRVRAARAYARKLVQAADRINYSQILSRPMQLGGLGDIPRHADCSSSVTIIYHAAGIRDPNGR